MNVCLKYKWKVEMNLKKIDIKNCVCHYFDDIINCTNIKFSNILLDKKFLKIFRSMKLYIKLQQV